MGSFREEKEGIGGRADEVFRSLQGGGGETRDRGVPPIAAIAREIHFNEGDLVNRYRQEHPAEELPLTIPERARLNDLEAENRELRMKAEFLGTAAAFFAQEYR